MALMAADRKGKNHRIDATSRSPFSLAPRSSYFLEKEEARAPPVRVRDQDRQRQPRVLLLRSLLLPGNVTRVKK